MYQDIGGQDYSILITRSSKNAKSTTLPNATF